MKHILSVVLLSLAAFIANAQDFGLSFSYFIPRHGYFSTPISPFSIRGLGVNVNRFVAIQTGGSLYRMDGLNIKDLPFESTRPLVGPNFTIFVPVELVLQLGNSNLQMNLKGGGFGFYGLDNKLNYGNFDRSIREYEGWAVANANLSFRNHPGFGYHFGGEVVFYVTKQIGLSVEANYLVGDARFPLSGGYTGGSSSLETRIVEYPDAKIDFTGIEFSFGIFYSSGQQHTRPRRR